MKIMKNLLFLTDFSATAKHAAEYGFNLARQIKANVLLCNIFIIPAETPHSTMLVWPMDDAEALEESSMEELKKLKTHLLKKHNEDFEPIVHVMCEEGLITDRVDDIVDANRIDMVVMGTHGSSGLSTLLLGNHARNMIDDTKKPLLLVPHTARQKPVKKIAYASDFTNKKEDLAAIYNLVDIAKGLNAEILIIHIQDEKKPSASFKKWLDEFLIELSNKANYHNIYYRIEKRPNTEYGLDWLCEHGQIDMLAMLHRPKGFLSNLINGSHTQKIANHIQIPLLVIPDNIVNTVDDK
jgi:nucleotide-binding universal stress UspA family protein